jgi:hydroxyethylthiazole kinase
VIDAKTIAGHLTALRAKAPLVHNITNYVVMNVTANALLALGASPIMAHAEEELPDLIAIASSLVINIGTLDAAWIASMRTAATLARQRNLPMILDPVGAGASRLRTATSRDLVELGAPAIVRGNASEIMALAGAAVQTKGVDSSTDTDAAEDAAKALAISAKCVVVVSGHADLVTDGTQLQRVAGGSAMMPRITGMGCTATAVIGAFAAVAPPFEAAIAGMAVMKVAAEIAESRMSLVRGPGTMAALVIDALFAMTDSDIKHRVSLWG